MKINVLGHLLRPWILFFFILAGTIVGFGALEHTRIDTHPLFLPLTLIGSLICTYFNFLTISHAGIWIAHNIPKHLKPPSKLWIRDILLGAGLIGLFYKIGELPWVPIYWQGFILPTITLLGLLIILRGILSPLLVWCSHRFFTRLAAMFVVIPFLFVFPFLGLQIGKNILSAYRISRSNPIPMIAIEKQQQQPSNSGQLESEDSELAVVNVESPASERAQKLKAVVEEKRPCPEEKNNILAGLTSKGGDDIVYWSMKALSCSDIRRIISTTKLIDIMNYHPTPKIRATAIWTIGRFPPEEVRRLGYLLVKHISSRERPEVIEAAATVLSRQGPEEYLQTISRLKDLLESPENHLEIARILSKNLHREDLIMDYVVEHLGDRTEKHFRAMGMVCILNPRDRKNIEAKIPQIIMSLRSGESKETAKLALECIGDAGFYALQKEVIAPQMLSPELAARTFSEMRVHHSLPALKTFEDCLHNSTAETQKWCSQGLGKVGLQALPRIIELLNSKEDSKIEMGQQALSVFDDLAAKEDLLKIRAENSGWNATQRKLKMAKVIDSALLRLEKMGDTTQTE